MNILAKSHKVVERRGANYLRRINNGISKMKKIKKRSLLTWWSYSSGREESFEDDEKDESSEELKSEDKWLAGCLIQCIYNKNGAIDRLGYPTLDGIVDLYTAGNNEQPFFIYTLRATNKCLKHVSSKYSVNRKKKPQKGVACSIALELFECVSDMISEYCR